jgi:hypothetical protein
MYSIYKIYQAEELVYATYHTMNNQYSDTIKLDIIINSPITPYYLVDAYFKNSSQFSIKLHKDGISNALEANEIIQKISLCSSNTVIKKPKNKKSSTKK